MYKQKWDEKLDGFKAWIQDVMEDSDDEGEESDDDDMDAEKIWASIFGGDDEDEEDNKPFWANWFNVDEETTYDEENNEWTFEFDFNWENEEETNDMPAWNFKETQLYKKMEPTYKFVGKWALEYMRLNANAHMAVKLGVPGKIHEKHTKYCSSIPVFANEAEAEEFDQEYPLKNVLCHDNTKLAIHWTSFLVALSSKHDHDMYKFALAIFDAEHKDKRANEQFREALQWSEGRF